MVTGASNLHYAGFEPATFANYVILPWCRGTDSNGHCPCGRLVYSQVVYHSPTTAIGGAKGPRSPDILLDRQALFQLSYDPEG